MEFVDFLEEEMPITEDLSVIILEFLGVLVMSFLFKEIFFPFNNFFDEAETFFLYLGINFSLTISLILLIF